MPPAKSGAKSGAPGQFKPGPDPRRGRGPKPGAPNAGRPKDTIRALAAQGLEQTLPGIVAIARGDPVVHLEREVAGGETVELTVSPRPEARIRAGELLARVAGEIGERADGTAREIVVRIERE